jgi:hypothetical protein
MSTLISPLRPPIDIAVVEDSVVETASVILHVPPFFIAVILNSYLRSSGVTMLEPRRHRDGSTAPTTAITVVS